MGPAPPRQGSGSIPGLLGGEEGVGQVAVTLVLIKAARGPLPSSDEVLSLLLREGATIWPVVRSTWMKCTRPGKSSR